MAFDAKKLRELRHSAGLSMQALAKKAGVGPTSVWMLESGNTPYPHMGTVAKLAVALGESEAVFFAAPNRQTDNTQAAS